MWNHPKFEFERGDIRDQDMVRSCLKGVNGIVHLAAIVGDPACARTPEEARAVNVDATKILFEECARARVETFVMASTCSNYGTTGADSGLADEQASLAPLSLYARTKVQCEEMLLDRSNGKGPNVTVMRLATLYGVSYRMRFDLTVNDFAMQMETKRHLVVHAAETWRPYVHVADAARAIRAIVDVSETTRNQVYNVGSTAQNFTKAQIVAIVKEQLPDTVVEYQPFTTDLRNYRVSFRKFEERLRFQSERTVAGAVGEVVRAVRSGVISRPDDPIYRN